MADAACFALLCVIVNFGMGSKVIHAAKQYGIKGSTVLLGKGTVADPVLEFLGLNDVRKEIVLMAADKATAERALESLDHDFKLAKPNHGIAYTMPIIDVIGATSYAHTNLAGKGEDKPMYQAITVIVDKGKATDVVDAAKKAGARGGTIINARGSGIHETSKLFAMEIEPEKELVLILAKEEKTGAIVSSIREHLEIDQPGNGIIYTQGVDRVCGLYE